MSDGASNEELHAALMGALAQLETFVTEATRADELRTQSMVQSLRDLSDRLVVVEKRMPEFIDRLSTIETKLEERLPPTLAERLVTLEVKAGRITIGTLLAVVGVLIGLVIPFLS